MQKFAYTELLVLFKVIHQTHIFQTIDVLQDHVKMAGHVPLPIMGINVSADPDIAEITVKVCISLIQQDFRYI